MGQLQATVRAYALDGHSPAAVLDPARPRRARVPDLHFTTCVVARLEPATGALLVCSAGHLPPVVADADGGARLLEVEPGRPLGVGGGEYVDQALDAARSARAPAVHRRAGGGARRPARPRASTGSSAPSRRPCARPTTPATQVLRALGRDAGTDDDTAVLALHRCGDGMLEVRLPRTALSARSARRGVRDVAAAARRRRRERPSCSSPSWSATPSAQPRRERRRRRRPAGHASRGTCCGWSSTTASAAPAEVLEPAGPGAESGRGAAARRRDGDAVGRARPRRRQAGVVRGGAGEPVAGPQRTSASTGTSGGSKPSTWP